MTFTDAAAEVLRLVGKPLHYKEITDIAIEKNLLSHVGKSPEVTMGARLAATLKKDTAENPLVRVKPGVFALREWDEKTIKAGLEGKKAKRGAKPEAAKERGRGGAEEAVEAEEAASAPDEEAAGADTAEAEDEDEVLVAPDAEDAEADAESERPAAVAAPPAAPSGPRAAAVYADDEEDEDAEPAGPDEAMR